MADETVLYLFGFMSSSNGRIHLTTPTAGQDGDVFLVESGDVAVAATVVRARDYERPPAGSSPSHQLQWVAPLALRHYDVLQRLHARGTIVPLKFGALCPDVDHARSTLRRLRDPIHALLTRFEGKDEWVLEVSADREAVAAAVREARPDLIARQEDTRHMAAGAAYFARKRLENLIADLVSEELDACRALTSERLAHVGVERAAADASVPGRNGPMVPLMHEAWLVDRSSFAAIERTLGEIEADFFSLRLTCELRGPLPAFSFVDTIAIA